MLYLLTFVGFMFFSKMLGMPFGESVFVPSIIFLIGIISQVFRYGFHVNDFNDIQRIKADIETYKEQASEVLAEVRLYLCEKYPEQEMKIFEMISNNTVDILAVKYPEIKSNETVMKAVNNIINFNNFIYKNKRKINQIVAVMKTRKSTMWLTGLPILPMYDLDGLNGKD